MSTQETSNRPVREKTLRDLRNFGWTMAGCFAVFGLLLRWKWGAESVVPPVLGILAALFLLAGTLAPAMLRGVEKLWMAFAERLSIVMTFVIMVALFYLVITPTGLFLRLLGKDLLQRKIRRDIASYWTTVEADGPGSRPYLPF